MSILPKHVTSACYDNFHVRQANSGKISTFRGYLSLTPACAGPLNAESRDLDCSNRHSILKILCVGHLRLSSAISAKFTLEMCVAAQKNH